MWYTLGLRFKTAQLKKGVPRIIGKGDSTTENCICFARGYPFGVKMSIFTVPIILRSPTPVTTELRGEIKWASASGIASRGIKFTTDPELIRVDLVNLWLEIWSAKIVQWAVVTRWFVVTGMACGLSITNEKSSLRCLWVAARNCFLRAAAFLLLKMFVFYRHAAGFGCLDVVLL